MNAFSPRSAAAAACSDPFAPLSDADHEQVAAGPAEDADPGGTGGTDDNVELLPCPDQSPSLATFKHGQHGLPSDVWFYRNPDGAPWMAAARYELPDGKQVLPQS